MRGREGSFENVLSRTDRVPKRLSAVFHLQFLKLSLLDPILAVSLMMHCSFSLVELQFKCRSFRGQQKIEAQLQRAWTQAHLLRRLCFCRHFYSHTCKDKLSLKGAGEDRTEFLTNKSCIRAIFKPPVTGRSCSSDPVLCLPASIVFMHAKPRLKAETLHCVLLHQCEVTGPSCYRNRLSGFFFFFFLPADSTSERNTFMTRLLMAVDLKCHLPVCLAPSSL